MIVSCDSCGRKYTIDPNKMKSPVVHFKCKDCGKVLTADRAAAQSAPAPTPMPEPAPTPPPRPAPEPMPELSATQQKSSGKAAKGKRGSQPKIKGMSIRTKITLIIVLLVIVSLSVVGFIAEYQGRSALSDLAEQHLAQISSQKAREYGLIFHRLQNEAQAVANYATLTFARKNVTSDLGKPMLMPWTGSGYGTPEMFRANYQEILYLQRVGFMLRSLVKNNAYLSLGYMATPSKITVFDDDAIVDVIKKVKGYDPTGRPWYKGAVAAGKTIWTEPYVDANTKKLVVTCATPVYRPDKSLIGVIGFDVLLDTIQKDILSMDIGYNGYAFLVGHTGKALVRPGMSQKDTRWDETYKADNLLRTSNAQFNAIVAKMIHHGRGVDTYTSETGRRIIGYAPVADINAGVGLVVSEADVIQPAIVMQKLIITVWVVVLCLAILIGMIIGGRITRPINELTNMADLISQGKVDLEVLAEDRTDEIGLLTRAFNRLVISLQVAMTRR